MKQSIEANDTFMSFTVHETKTGVYTKQELRINLEEPDNKQMLKPYINNENLTLQIRESKIFYGLSSDEATSLALDNKECLFCFLDDCEGVTYHPYNFITELIEWNENNPEYCTSDGYYTVCMDRILSKEEQTEFLIRIGFYEDELAGL